VRGIERRGRQEQALAEGRAGQLRFDGWLELMSALDIARARAQGAVTDER